jgi:transcriptional regulator with XRE-family HTH domain
MEVHVGNLIERRLEEMGMTKAEFGRRINTSRQNVNSLLRKKSLDTSILQRICDALKYDFFKHFSLKGVETPLPPPPPPTVVPPLATFKILVELPAELQDQFMDVVIGKGRLEVLQKMFKP